jgi:Xaa-Pro dipeptidase
LRREVEEKLGRIRRFLKQEGYDGVLLTTNENFCWLSGGRSAFVDKSTGAAASKLMVTESGQYVICNSSERYRVMEEELPEDGFELITYQWHEDEYQVLADWIRGKRFASDSGVYGTENCSAGIQRLRYVLTEEETARYRKIGPESAGILEHSCREIRRGESELEIASRTVQKLMEKGYQVPVCLVAADERLRKYRHPIPTQRRVDKYAMTAICAQKYGLTVSISRIVSLGEVDEDRAKRMEAVQRIDAAYISNTKTGVLARNVLEKGFEAYQKQGYGEDFHLHHQGGALGYATRDYCADFTCSETVLGGQAFSWNPTIAGVKSEDTFLVSGDRQEIVSHTGNWVYREISCGSGMKLLRPEILVLQEV